MYTRMVHCKRKTHWPKLSESPIYLPLAKVTYYFFSVIALEILISIFFIVEGGTIRSRFSRRYQTTVTFVSVFLIIATAYFLFEEFASNFIRDYLVGLQNVLYPLSVLSVSFSAFYLTRVILGRRWRFPLTLSTLSICLMSLGITLYMISNNGILLWWYKLIMKLTIFLEIFH